MQVLPLTLGTYSSSACQTCGCSETSCETCQTVADCSNCASCCCTTAHQSWRHRRIGNGISIEYLSSGWMAVEVFGSIGVGLIAGSFALLAFGSDSLIELISGVVIVMPYLYIQKKRIGRETLSLALSMDAIESVTCLFMATALLGGLLAEYFLGLWWADYLATGIILAFVAREAVESYRELHEEESVAHT